MKKKKIKNTKTGNPFISVIMARPDVARTYEALVKNL